MFKKYLDIFIDFSFTPWGIVIWSAVGGIIMSILTYFTTALKVYTPLSYGIAFAFGIIAILIILKFILSIWITFSQRIFTKKPTFIEYKLENERLHLIKKSNIYKEPSCILMTPKQNTSITAPLANIIVIFERPISSSSILTKIKNISGPIPTKDSSTIDERWATIALSNIKESSYFRIYFNDTEEINN